jgi:hypothetical protein
MRLLCVATSPSSHPYLPFLTQPKSSRPHWLEFLMSFDLDTCQRSNRGFLGLFCYLRNPSLIHSTPFFKVLLLYPFLTTSLSLSHCHLSLVHLFLKSLEQLCCYNLFHWIIKNLLWRNREVLDRVYMFHLFAR